MAADFGATHRAIVRSVTTDGVVVEIPSLAPNAAWGPIPTAVPNLVEGDAVLVTQVSTSRDTLIVVGRVPGRAPEISEIPSLAAAIAALQAVDSSIQSAATDLTTRVTTAEGTIISHGTRLTTDETNITSNASAITSLTARVTALEDQTAVGRTRTVYQHLGNDQQQNNANGGTTYTNSVDLTLPVVANGIYIVKSQFLYDTVDTVGIKLKFNPPTGSGLRLSPWFSTDNTANAATAPLWHDAFDGFEFTPGGKPAGGMLSCRPGGWLIVAGTAGSLTVQFAQATAGAPYAVLKSGSMMELTRVA